MNGMIIKNGYVITEFGDIKRVDMAFSVIKVLSQQWLHWLWTKDS